MPLVSSATRDKAGKESNGNTSKVHYKPGDNDVVSSTSSRNWTVLWLAVCLRILSPY